MIGSDACVKKFYTVSAVEIDLYCYCYYDEDGYDDALVNFELIPLTCYNSFMWASFVEG
jgi:hypothetical protein